MCKRRKGAGRLSIFALFNQKFNLWIRRLIVNCNRLKDRCGRLSRKVGNNGMCFVFARGEFDEITGLKSVVASWKAIEIAVYY
jgi:hypothetical protein